MCICTCRLPSKAICVARSSLYLISQLTGIEEEEVSPCCCWETEFFFTQ